MSITFRAGSCQRFLAAALLALVIIVGQALWPGAQSPSSAAVYDADELGVVRLINQYRASYGLGALQVSDALSKASTRHNLDMGHYNFLSHSSESSDFFPSGYQFWQRLAAMGYGSGVMGENIAAGLPLMTAESVFAAWKSSPGHNSQMLGADYRAIGVSCDYVAGSEFGVYWTTDFGGSVDSTARPVDKAGVRTTITGQDRYETAVMVSQRGFPNGASVVVVVKGDDFPDALAAAPLAAAFGGPVLLTPSGGLTSAVKAELKRLGAHSVFFIGLKDSVKSGITSALPNATITTIRGRDRYETATLIADRLRTRLGRIDTVVLVPGDRYPDALSVAPLAAKKGWAILLTPQSGQVPTVTARSIQSLGATSALVVGTWAKPPIAASQVTYKVGTDRYHTSALVAAYAASQGLSFGHVALATGENYPDALVVGPYLVGDGGILLLTQASGIPTPVADQLAAHRSSVAALDLVGLTDSVSTRAKMILQ